mmetsp:Transcript_2519/g.5415  ORF Transcript_2519/g.5415 Transcript_2519/m.5415 type:complete len:313 (-) Transcript_2519:233-1171(-)
MPCGSEFRFGFCFRLGICSRARSFFRFGVALGSWLRSSRSWFSFRTRFPGVTAGLLGCCGCRCSVPALTGCFRRACVALVAVPTAGCAPGWWWWLRVFPRPPAPGEDPAGPRRSRFPRNGAAPPPIVPNGDSSFRPLERPWWRMLPRWRVVPRNGFAVRDDLRLRDCPAAASTARRRRKASDNNHRHRIHCGCAVVVRSGGQNSRVAVSGNPRSSGFCFACVEGRGGGTIVVVFASACVQAGGGARWFRASHRIAPRRVASHCCHYPPDRGFCFDGEKRKNTEAWLLLLVVVISLSFAVSLSRTRSKKRFVA